MYIVISLAGLFIVSIVINRGNMLRTICLPLLFSACFASGLLIPCEILPSLKSYLFISTVLISLWGVTPFVFRTIKDCERFFAFVAFLAVIASLWAIFEMFRGEQLAYTWFPAEADYFKRFSSYVPIRPVASFFHPAVLGSFLVAALPFIITSVYLRQMVIRFFVITLVLSVMVLTFSRGVFIAAVATGLLYMILALRRNRIKTILFVLFAIVLLSAVLSYMPYPLSKFGLNDLLVGTENQTSSETNSGVLSEYRLTRMRVVYDVVRRYPCGFGIEAFRGSYFMYACAAWWIPPCSVEFWILDNMYLTVLVESGILGFAGLSIMIIIIFVRASRRLRQIDNGKDERLRKLLITAIASCAGLCVHMAAYELFYWPNIYIVFCYVLSITSHLANNATGFDNG
jgi:O-antigen ligase